MAVVNTLSAALTNANATPPVFNPASATHGVLHRAFGVVEVAAADDNDSTYRMVRLPSNAVVYSIRIWNDAITGGTSYDCGLYRTAADGGAVVDKDLFASAVDIAAGLSGTELRFEAGSQAGIEYYGETLWKIADRGDGTYTTDPNIMFDIVLTANTVGTGAGTILLVVDYSV